VTSRTSSPTSTNVRSGPCRLSDHEDLAYGLLIFLSIVLIVTVGTESLEETITEEVTENVGEEILDRRRDRINRRGRQERSFLPRIGPVTH